MPSFGSWNLTVLVTMVPMSRPLMSDVGTRDCKAVVETRTKYRTTPDLGRRAIGACPCAEARARPVPVDESQVGGGRARRWVGVDQAEA